MGIGCITSLFGTEVSCDECYNAPVIEYKYVAILLIAQAVIAVIMNKSASEYDKLDAYGKETLLYYRIKFGVVNVILAIIYNRVFDGFPIYAGHNVGASESAIRIIYLMAGVNLVLVAVNFLLLMLSAFMLRDMQKMARLKEEEDKTEGKIK